MHGLKEGLGDERKAQNLDDFTKNILRSLYVVLHFIVHLVIPVVWVMVINYDIFEHKQPSTKGGI